MAGALAIDRLGFAGTRPIEWRHTLIRGDRFSLAADFSARTGYQLHLGPRDMDQGNDQP
jgi:GntR family transcriptional regulator